jgi:sulfane dehydrogenase subunit SoxC
MSDEPPLTSRRAFLRGTGRRRRGAGGQRTAAARPHARPADHRGPALGQAFGDPVDATPYGMPIEHESHVVRRNVEWLTESPVSSINFTPIHALEGTITPQGCAFERHHSGAIELTKQDYRLMINGLVDKPLVFTYADLNASRATSPPPFANARRMAAWNGAARSLKGCQFTQA